MYKSTGDVEGGTALYKFYSDVHDRDEPHFLSRRATVLARKQPRKMFVQHNSVVDGKAVNMVGVSWDRCYGKIASPGSRTTVLLILNISWYAMSYCRVFGKSVLNQDSENFQPKVSPNIGQHLLPTDTEVKRH